MRGEDNQPPIEKLAKSGSPPHARGRRFADPAANLPSGITPACAGKTSSSSASTPNKADHPRMRGEDFLHSRNRKRGKGSPPHARGRQPMTSALRLRWGITPACAGKTPTPTNPTQPSPDHPRMRGEDPTTIPVWLSPAGSPPHARGRRVPDIARPSFLGITPACAGKTPRWHTASASTSDHPRMRGEDILGSKVRAAKPGSPPHARGRQLGRDLGSVGARITPACAGKTAQRVYREIEASDHPRMRGEDSRSTGPCWCGGGSPPHARGRRRRADFQPAIRRITPACAGKTSQAQGLG